MTREEAIKYLKGMKDECNDTIHKVRYVTQEEVLDMAIKALEQEPSGDVISRQAVIDVIKSMSNANPSYWNKCDVVDREDLIDEISELPSVKQEPFINKPCISQGVCREDKAKVLDKIRAEIETKIKEENYGVISDHTHEDGLEEALEIIDKYTKGESE